MSYRYPADMHSDGVYFNDELLALKKKQDLLIEKIESLKSQKTED